jgi:hypothetical protein
MRNRLAASALLTAALLGGAARARAAEGPTLTAEDKVLNRFLGTWRSTYKVPKGEANPEERRGTAELTFTRVLGGKFLQERRQLSDKNTNMTMYTYDTERKTYGAWWFSSTGQAAFSTGKWDEETRTMTWTSGEEAVRTTSHYRFVTDDSVEWDVVIKEKDRVVFRMEGKNTRALPIR